MSLGIRVVTAAVLAFALSSCIGDPPQTQPTIAVPTLRVPTYSPIAPYSPRQGPQAPQPTQTVFDPTAAYPLNQAQALGYLGVGVSVAGLMAGGGEGVAMRTTETVYEDKQVQREKCKDEYDYYEQKTVYKCRYEYVTEKVPVEKTVYLVMGGVARQSFSMPVQAIAAISAYGVVHWRKV